MQQYEILRLFQALNTWGSGDQRAPHKPLLVLHALGCWQRGEVQIPFSEINVPLTASLKEFGPPRKAHHPEYPFWRLQNDGVWNVVTKGQPKVGADGSPSKGELLRCDARGSFSEEVQVALRDHPSLVGEIARELLQAHFPSSIHEDIADSVGLNLLPDRATGGRRDPDFRRRVLTSYEYRCAVCGLQLLLSGIPIALEAAHIKWHQASGPAILQNGLSLCVLHHKVFDLGAFTLNTNHLILVSDEVAGLCGLSEHLLIHHGKRLISPIQSDAVPAVEFIEWHRQEVFRGQSRPI